VRGRAAVWRRGPVRREAPDPLPARFRLTSQGKVVPVDEGGGDGTGAGGGIGEGPAHHGDDPPAGAVLVVRTLEPSLAPLLGRLAGLVAETGSPLAHLAILAREAGVPTVVGLRDAWERFEDGEVLTVDGTTGRVRSATTEQTGAMSK
jgi:phosphohistidine swiveling domain-containing protein